MRDIENMYINWNWQQVIAQYLPLINFRKDFNGRGVRDVELPVHWTAQHVSVLEMRGQSHTKQLDCQVMNVRKIWFSALHQTFSPSLSLSPSPSPSHNYLLSAQRIDNYKRQQLSYERYRESVRDFKVCFKIMENIFSEQFSLSKQRNN